MGVGKLQDIHGGFVPFVRNYAIFKAIKKLSQKDKRVDPPEAIIVKGDLVGGHVGRELWDYQDPHDWVRVVNFIRVRAAKKLALSGASEECIDYIVQKHIDDGSLPKDPKPEAIEKVVNSEYTSTQAELSEKVIETAGTEDANFSYTSAETDYIPMAVVMGNQDRMFMEYVTTKKIEKSPLINKRTLDLIKAQADYAFQGYKPEIFFELMKEIAGGDIPMPQDMINERLREILGAEGVKDIEKRHDYHILQETIPAVAFLKKIYEKQKEPAEQCMLIAGKSVKALITHSYPPGSDNYISYREGKSNHISPKKAARMLPKVEKELGIAGKIEVNVVSYAHYHAVDESVETFFDPKSRKIRSVLLTSSGNSGHSIEARGAYKTATASMMYDVAPSNCTMIIEGPI
ncbi:hypothetical protein KY360_03440 [Candidatus Woesearchaeota archaeon]|nr:hypothetical protein [Candidatus Woesearchaeota archaeon]